MKQLYILLIFLAFSLVIHAQSKGTISLYGYQQSVLPGTIPKGVITEDGKEVEITIKPRFNYWFYTASHSKIYPVEIWVKGSHHLVRTQSRQTPVEVEIPTVSKKVMVPKTSKNVLELELLPSVNGKHTAKGKSLSKTHTVVLVYKANGKLFYQTLSGLKELPPAAMQ
jgi:hypothetical protein